MRNRGRNSFTCWRMSSGIWLVISWTCDPVMSFASISSLMMPCGARVTNGAATGWVRGGLTLAHPPLAGGGGCAYSDGRDKGVDCRVEQQHAEEEQGCARNGTRRPR